MTIALYMDVHIHRAITVGLKMRGIDVLTAQEDGYGRADDSELLNRATELNRVLFTQDDDLLVEAHFRQANNIPFTGVVYGHQLQVTIGLCVEHLELLAQACMLEDMMNRVEYLPLLIV